MDKKKKERVNLRKRLISCRQATPAYTLTCSQRGAKYEYLKLYLVPDPYLIFLFSLTILSIHQSIFV